MMSLEDSRRRLMWHGMLLFLLGLLTGLLEAQFANPRMGLAAHLEGVMNGPFLAVLGAIWTDVRLSQTAKSAAFWAALYGAYVNWLTTVAAAAFGTAALSPITASGHHAAPWQEALVTIGFATAGLAIVIATVLVLWGVRRVAIA